MKNLKKITLLALVLCFSWSWVSAKADNKKADSAATTKNQAQKTASSQKPQDRGQARFNKMQEKLKLSESQSQKIKPIISSYTEKRFASYAQKRESFSALRKELKSAGEAKPNNKKIQASLKAFLKSDQEVNNLKDKEYAAVSPHLNDMQKAQFIVLRQEMQQNRGGSRGRRGQQGQRSRRRQR